MPNIPGFNDTVDLLLGIQDQVQLGGPPRYYSRSAAISLSENGEPTDSQVAELVPALMTTVEARFDQLGRPTPSESNWKWQKHLHIAENNLNPETVLEKLIANVMPDSWANQMPIWNGMEEGRANASRIDLVHRLSETRYSMIELKFGIEDNQGSDHPLYAILEVLKYGLVYLLYRKHDLLTDATSKDHHILKATEIGLKVMAPDRWYQYRVQPGGDFRPFNLSWLIDGINRSLQRYIDENLPQCNIRMQIKNCCLPVNFVDRFVTLTSELKYFRGVFADAGTCGSADEQQQSE